MPQAITLALANRHDWELVGGDTTRGPLNSCITVFGKVPVVHGKSQALLRSGVWRSKRGVASATACWATCNTC
ncbi:thiamine monophosphate kinase [Polaromonas sp. CG_9.11]|nr:thiamine monophosphate kinase [Polaromonas sp. CG_9.11]